MNFDKIFNIKKMNLPEETFQRGDSNDSDIYLNESMTEILVTLPSILLMLKQYDRFDKLIKVFDKHGLQEMDQIFTTEEKNLIQAKIKMIECSKNLESEFDSSHLQECLIKAEHLINSGDVKN